MCGHLIVKNLFFSVKRLLCMSPVLAAPNFEKPFKIQVDASRVVAGALLLQEEEGDIDHPVCVFSRKFKHHQLNYSVVKKKTLALIWALQFIEVYVSSGSKPITLFTDQNSNQRLMRWALFLQSYNLNICHIKGLENVMADALSRGLV